MARSRMTRRDLLRASTALAMTAVVAACAPAAPPTNTPAPAPKATEAPKPAATTAPAPTSAAAATPAPKSTEAPKPAATAAPATKAVNVELASTNHPVEQPLNDEMADKFIKNGHSNYTIKRTYIAGNIWEKLQTLVAAGTPPDLFYQGGMQTFAFAVKGVVVALDDWIKRDATAMNYAEILPASLAHFNWRGKQYGLPVNAHGYPLSHNLDLYSKAGLKPPDENTTWASFLDLGKQIAKDEGGKRVQWLTHSMTSWTNFIQIVRAEGGDLLDKGMTKCVLDSDAGIKTIQWIADLENVAKVAPKAADVAGIDAFGTGKLASIVDGFWNVGSRKVPFQWDSGSMPKGSAKRSTLNLSAGWGQSTASKFPDEVWELHKWMTGVEYQTRGAQVQLNIPNRKSVRENPEIQAIPHIKPFIAALEYSDAPPYNPRWDEMIKLVADSLQPVWDGKAKADQAVKAMAPKVTQLITGM